MKPSSAILYSYMIVKSIMIFLAVNTLKFGQSIDEMEISVLNPNTSSMIFPEPFVLFKNKKKEFDTVNAVVIQKYIVDETNKSLQNEKLLHAVTFTDSEYVVYGNELGLLMYKLSSTRDIDTVELSPFLKNICEKDSGDLCLFIYALTSSRNKGANAGKIMLGVITGLLTGFAITPGLDMVGSDISVAVYSKSKDHIIYFNHDQDKDDPLIEKNTRKQISTLLEDFISEK